MGEQQAAELTSGLPHDRYLFTSGALTALYRVFRLVDDLIAATEKLEALTNDRTKRDRARDVRHANTFVNTPWYDGWRDASAVESPSGK